jgi:hypothetical protein
MMLDTVNISHKRQRSQKTQHQVRDVDKKQVRHYIHKPNEKDSTVHQPVMENTGN